jgi:dTDP-4-amino-4,6-dideoxygalactose transaminase
LSDEGAGANLVLPSWTFTASAGAALLSGLDAEFADIDTDWRVQTSETDSFVLDVLPFGEGLRANSEKSLKSRWRVIDGAASFDALRGAASRLDKTSVLVVSMHATKLLGAGEGGVCITGSPEIAREIKSWSSFGFKGSRDSQRLGSNSKISEYTAAVGLASLDMWNETRSLLQMHLNKALEISKSCGLGVTGAMKNNQISPYWIVNFDSADDRDRVQAKLNDNGIETRTWWGSGCHKMEAYKSVPCRKLPNTEWAAATSLGLPFHAYLSDEDYELIHRVLSS